jgi:hypothetical protein
VQREIERTAQAICSNSDSDALFSKALIIEVCALLLRLKIEREMLKPLVVERDQRVPIVLRTE